MIVNVDFIWIFVFFLIYGFDAQLNNNNNNNLILSSKISRALKNTISNNQQKIQYENYKALVGETIRLECPQPNPTWFFRRLSNENLNNLEDIIVTRHGIINSDYKYKIMCHMTLKHKVIIINNIDFDEEGLYTCLYTLPNDQVSKLNNFNNDLVLNNPIQYRYVFNVTVYSLLSGLNMNFESTKSSPAIIESNRFNLKNNDFDNYQSIENSLTVKENEEFTIKCTVDSSKPAADINFSIKSESLLRDEMPSLNNNHFSSFLTLSPSTQAPKIASLISEETNIIKNNDLTFKTVHTARLKANRLDHGKTISCLAENGFSNQKWENKKILNVLYAPVCKDPPKFVYYVGINQTVNIECRILNANPSKITYDWMLDNIRKSSEFRKSEHYEVPFSHDFLVDSDTYKLPDQSSSSSSFNSKNLISFQNEEFTSRFKWRPNDFEQFGEISCKATNEIGSTECKYEIKLGGVPNPPYDCTYTLKNSSAIISCMVGFHQGDPDIYCYLLKKSENGVYKEHTRNRESCSFIVNDVNINKLNEFWIYSSNKHGHNKDMGFHLSIGQAAKALEPENNKNMILIGIVTAVFVFCIAACCFCFRVKKGLTDDSESISETDPYQIKNGIKIKQSDNSIKMIKGVKLMNHRNFNDDIDYTNKFLKVDLNNDTYLDKNTNVGKKYDQYEEAKKYKLYDEKKTSFTLNKNKLKIDESSIKKSSSFFEESNNNNSINEDHTKLLKEPTPFFNKTEKQLTKGLLKTLDDGDRDSKNSINSINELNSSNKMVTFSKPANLFIKNTNQSLGNFENHTNTTVSTSVSTSSSGSTGSPNTYSSNDSDSVERASMLNANKLTVSDQSFNIQANMFLKNQNMNRLACFSETVCKNFQSPRHFKETREKSPTSPSSSKLENSLVNSQEYSAKLSDSFETKYLNKLCEDIEVSLNVDCDCADDYSVNDFSGDYSFDNGYKTPIYSSIPSRQILSTSNSSQNAIETRKSLEFNNVRCLKNKSQSKPKKDSGSIFSTFSQKKDSTDSQNSANVNQLGVLV